jgi:hypothetical protein
MYGEVGHECERDFHRLQQLTSQVVETQEWMCRETEN